MDMEPTAVGSSDLCPMCHEAPETVDHIFMGCPVSKEVWLQVCSWWRLLEHSPSSCRELLDCKELLGGHQRLKVVQEAIMLVLWVIWRFINSKTHALNSNSISKLVLAYEVQAHSHLWINAQNQKGQNLRWIEWCCDPIFECYYRM
uniref:Reverse transcriptase zinc-binding domain-containing protein n=1 Tax=Lactuca sativa TaxID=4236 RepID=A0A9R1XDL0_LACSA|nr:hypothetical protein LSAT_V11C400208010 [Lactuca sativa]